MGKKRPKSNLISVPNKAAVGTDRACAPITVHVPVLLVESEDDHLEWVNETMDYSAAAQMQSLASLSGILIRILTVQLILPSADDVNTTSSDLDEMMFDPVRLKLKTPTTR